MKLLNQFDSLLIEDVKEVAFSCAHHSHTYYEIVYIHSGEGMHYFNESNIPYSAGDLFLVSPGDHHDFTIENPTHFTYIKFTEAYFNSKQHLSPDEFYSSTPESIMKLRSLKEIKIEFEDPYKSIIQSTINNIVYYSSLKKADNSQTVFYLILTIFGMIKEVMQTRTIRLNDNDPNSEQISSYIHEHIYEREKVTIKNIAEHFNISPTYFSNFFKRIFGISYQNYLDSYRIKLVEKRIETGGLKFKQIADEFGFTDVSHMAKSFKKQKGISPTQFRDSLNSPN